MTNCTEYRYTIPQNDLAAYVTLFYDFTAGTRAFDRRCANPVDFRFCLTQSHLKYHFADGSMTYAPEAHLIGSSTESASVSACSPISIFGFGLSSLGWALIAGNATPMPPHRIISANGFFGGSRSLLRNTALSLRAAHSVDQRSAIATRFIMAMMRRSGHALIATR
jgi:hypothetical protein